ncbi:MAG: SMI1/KNR4 family protein [Parachlamydiaceae bacterium]|nr:SMI1/KNR4 family protein [Parachlamydiaceae bacterium]
MDHHIKGYFSQFRDDSPKGQFHKVIALHDGDSDLSWESVTRLIPQMSKGWFELAHLPAKDRIEFIGDFWLSKLPFHPLLAPFLQRFFDSLNDVGVFITQRTYDDPYEASLVYSLKNDSGFFRGALPATEQEISDLQKSFAPNILPNDYYAFLRVHNGFWKTTDCTGLIRSQDMPEKYATFQTLLEQEGSISTSRGKPVNPKALIPFYESFGMPFYQCFWAEWYPEQEMGNVYYSDSTKTIFDVESSDPSAESMAFSTFLDWLMFYMERID